MATLKYISMDFEEYLKICSRPFQLIKDIDEVTSQNSTHNFFSDWGTLEHEIPQGSISVPLYVHNCINDLPLRINYVSEPILFTDDTSVIILSRNFGDTC
jgi:hypothetical protein